jgi:xanthine dehydrogenase YagR molybdenum-binding subunit
LRLRNEPDDDPVKGWEFWSRHLKAAYQLGAEKFGWSKEKRVPGSIQQGDWLIGHGVATAYYPVYRFPASVRLRMHRDATVVIQSGAHEMGMGTRTAQTQAAAERLGLPMESVLFEYGSTDFPDAPQAGGSAQTIRLVDISFFAWFGYDEPGRPYISLPVLPINSPYPTDYRTRPEIERAAAYVAKQRGA